MPVLREDALGIKQYRDLLVYRSLKVGASSVKTNHSGGLDDQVFSIDPNGRLDDFENSQAVLMRSNSVGTSERERRVAAVTG
jgi:hypothetical protein